MTTEEQRAYALGIDAGKARGSWVLDGNSTEADAEAVLRAAGDCELEMPAPFSGEWADDYSVADLFNDVEFAPADEADSGTEIIQAFEEGYSMGFEAEAVRSARAILGRPGGTEVERDAALAEHTQAQLPGDLGGVDRAPDTHEHPCLTRADRVRYQPDTTLATDEADLVYGMLTQRLFLRDDDPDRGTVDAARNRIYPLTSAYAEAQQARREIEGGA